ncbi:hypothetical protein [Arthrospira platensis]|uniref:Uncharacterized protein n=1 Tax=Limnospira platensis NIES-46 TaxID=1236695 RepID=A0A5M3TG00_LIMPL|nr:hypothetical protein [Arthrospira platensis]AMW29147.1 hypothetical protein AP285_15450 [Arthrospira platensis YZ]KDR57294.1 hypothetical protein APPUASWS_011740 [Arthrospira platensis str. Paraca]MBD2672086.1 hypothetical protein [Arthrospira platensis FACHB-439]MBD2713195.1 hypothetical protein [Arthrospira platensis FACHB-835]MDF2213002.1 hypothetical protein [Arthrospira platensis NCB002]MDT9185764.1 hypothetical protein [Limnospira sp. PMC 289.06]MDT9298008.1 hypothetical protein [Ar
MKKLTNQQKADQLSVLVQHLTPSALNTMHKDLMSHFNRDIDTNLQKQDVKKILEAIENGELPSEDSSAAGDHLLISMAWQIFSINYYVKERLSFDDISIQKFQQYADAALQKTKLFLEQAKIFITEENGES